jgi:hypothetical protein
MDPETSSGRRAYPFTHPNTPKLSFPRKREPMVSYFRTRYVFSSHEDTKTGSNFFMPSCLCANHFADRRDRPQPALGRREYPFTHPNTPKLSFPRKRESMVRYFRTRYVFGSHEDTKTGTNLFVPSCLCANYFADGSAHGFPLTRE